MRKLEREALLADRETVAQLLSTIPESDPIGRLSFESRLREIDEELERLDRAPTTLGSVALVFGGRPVIGSRSIDATFSSKVLSTFQDLVTRHVVSQELGGMGTRGPVAMKRTTSLGISHLVRGSVGFVLEEQADNLQLVDSRLKKAIDHVVDVIGKTASSNSEDFEAAVEDLDDRILVSLRQFFQTLDDEQAQLRLVEDEAEHNLDLPAIHRARQRVERIEIEEKDGVIVIGELLGLLPQARRFEMKLRSGDLIKGRVAAPLAEKYLELIEQPDQGIVGRTWRTRMNVREVKERNREARKLYTLLGLLSQV